MGQTRRPETLLLISILLLSLLACARAPQPGDPLNGLTRAERDRFERGRLVFERAFTPENGLGPLFNAESCLECHEDPTTGGNGDEFEVHGSISGATGDCDLLFASGGPVFQLRVTPALREALGIDAEPIPEGISIGKRSAPDVFGFGLLDAVPEADLLSRADPDDRDGDGISGRPNRFLDGRMGRFGRKAFLPSLTEFNAGAFVIEQSVTNPASPQENSVGGAPLPEGVDPVAEPEIDAETVSLANDFVRFLAPAPRRAQDATARIGERVFSRVRCDACHVPKLRTGPHEVRALANRTFAAYTDLLLHDMGPELADICFGEATAAEFRTEPLMGLRFATQFLHDGRAATTEEAIRLHGGEAAGSRAAFLALSDRERHALLRFLGGL